MASAREIYSKIKSHDPQLLAGEDEYVFDCLSCPNHLPEIIVEFRDEALSQEVDKLLMKPGKKIEPDVVLAFLSLISGDSDEWYADRFKNTIEHVNASHPGKVVCKGQVEVDGHVSCGAIIERVPCAPEPVELAEKVIFQSVEKQF